MLLADYCDAVDLVLRMAMTILLYFPTCRILRMDSYNKWYDTLPY